MASDRAVECRYDRIARVHSFESESSVARVATRSRFANHPSTSAIAANSASLLTQTLRIYLEDTDAGGIVYHASWLRFFERARTDWLRDLGIEQSTLGPSAGIGFVVCDMQISFLRPGRLDQTIRTELRLAEARRASLLLTQTALDGSSGSDMVRATVRIAAIQLADQRAAPLPRVLLAELAKRGATPNKP